MAEKNVVREDVVSIAFDIEDDGLKEVQEMMKELKKVVKDAAGGVDDVIDELKEGFDEAGDAAKEAAKEISKGFKDVEKVIKDTGQEAAKTTRETKKETETLSKGLKSNLVNGLKSVKSGMASVGVKVIDTASKFKNFVNTKFDKLINGLKKFNKAADESKNKVKELSEESGGSRVGSGIKSTVAKAAGALAVGATAKNVVSTGMSFEAGMSTVKAVSGANDYEMEQLTEKAKEMGKTTVFSASESAEAMNYMAMAGWKSEQMINGIEGIMNLAAASGEDLGTTSDIVTDALTAFGMKAEESGRFADVLAVASSSANTNVAMMGETFKYAAASAGAMGYSCEDVAVAIGLMANAGIKESRAGTALNSVITRMAKPTKESAVAIENLGLSLKDSKGNMKSFREIMVDMRKGFKGLSEDEKASYAAMLAGKNAMSGLLAIVNASDEDFDKLTNAINNSTGAAKEMADIKNDNLLGQITLLKSGIEGFMIDMYDVIKTPLKGAVKWISEKFLPKVISGFSFISEALGPVFKNIIPIVKDVIERISLKFEWFKTNILPLLIDGFNTIKAAVIPVIETVIQKVIGLFDRIFGLIVQNKDAILNAWNSICDLFTYFTDSILPELVNVFNWVVQTIMPMISDIINAGSQLVQEAVPFIKEIVGDVIDVVKGIAPVVKGVIKIIVNAVKTVAKNIQSIIPVLKIVAKGYLIVKSAMLAYRGVVLLTNVVLQAHLLWVKAVDIAETLYIATLYAAETATKILNAVIAAGPWGWLAMAIGAVCIAGAAFIACFDDSGKQLEKNQEQIRKTASEVVSLQERMDNLKIPDVSFDNMISSRGNTEESIDKKIDEFEENITNILQERFAEQQKLREEDIANIKRYQEDIKNLEREKMGMYEAKLNTQKFLMGDNSISNNIELSSGLRRIENAKSIMDKATEEAEALMAGKIANLDNKFQGNATITLENGTIQKYEDELNEITAEHNKNLQKSEEIYKSLNMQILEYTDNLAKKHHVEWLDPPKYNEKAYSHFLSTKNDEVTEDANNALITAVKLKSAGLELSDRTGEFVNQILNAYDGLDSDLEEIGADSIRCIVKGLEGEIPGLGDTSTMSAQEMVNVIREYLDIHSPSRVMAEIGGNVIQGLILGMTIANINLMFTIVRIVSGIEQPFRNIKLTGIGSNIISGLVNGLNSAKERVVSTARQIAQETNEAFKNTLEIHSPSRVMRYNGQMVGEGLILGMDDKVPDIQSSFDNFDMSMGYTPENSSVGATNQSNTENNNISPVFNITVYGGDESAAERTKENIEDIFERMFEGYSRKSPRLTEV